MNRRMLIVGIALTMLLVPFRVYADDLGSIRLSVMEGDVQVLIQDTTDWTPAAINLPMNEHDRLWVPDDGRAELQIQGGVYARAGGNTSLDVLTVNRDSAQFYLDRGHLYVNNRRGGINTVQVDTPFASLRSYDNSIMMVDVTEDGVNQISVLKGIVYAESRSGATRVSAGNTLTIGGESSAELSPLGAPDEWEQWNVDRDRQVNAWSESSRYLPDELHEYSSDFDRSGSWDYVPEYGYSWFPTVVVADWTPYSYGSWIWIRGNHVWVDYAPWGWAPTHYGRWAFVSSRGWCWVPPAPGSVYWGPGYVGWVVTPTYVAWVPLAPGETYFGYGYYGPNSVNITTVNINTVVVNRTYVNARVRNSVVVTQRNSFGTGRRAPVRLQENPFEAREHRGKDISVVPPHVGPGRPIVIAPVETRERRQQAFPEQDRMRVTGPERRVAPQTEPAPKVERAERNERPAASSRVVPPSTGSRQQPPERVVRNRPEVLKNERPVVRQREASVFQQQPPQNLPVTRSREPRVVNRTVEPAPGGQSPAAGSAPHQNESKQPHNNQDDRRQGR